MIGVGSRVRSAPGREYVVDRHIKDGGQGSAWEVRGAHQRAVLKTLACPSAVARRAARMRAEALIALDLPRACRALAGTPAEIVDGSEFGYIAAFVPGLPLDEYVRRHFVERDLMLGLATALVTAVEVLEARAVAHGDLSPGNVLVFESDGVPRAGLIDFDNAVVVGGPSASMIGTPLYTAPELLRGTGVPGIAADRFSLGVLVCEMLLGRHPAAPYLPVGAKTRSQARVLSRNDWLRPDEHLRAGGFGVNTLAASLRRLLRRFLAAEPHVRPPPSELRRALRDALDHLWICPSCDIASIDDAERGDVCPQCDTRARPPRLVLASGRAITLPAPYLALRGSDVDPSEMGRGLVHIARVGWEVRVRAAANADLLVRGTWRALPEGTWIELRGGDRLRLGNAELQLAE